MKTYHASAPVSWGGFYLRNFIDGIGYILNVNAEADEPCYPHFQRGMKMDNLELLDELRQIVHEELSLAERHLSQRIDLVEKSIDSFENRFCLFEQRVTRRFDIVEKDIKEIDEGIRDILLRFDDTETDVRILKKLAAK
ncbi:hypothetical protein [Alicyclobacillus fodiniaquatilis]|uniref:Uncharacterized protein n=1 Tax=Alicyclobacillus fodiniaquatilis TaxID=1661150 RepID=A0ABW4JAC6_9BACL